ncbi:MAG: hypothetical protein AAB709_01645 [Patescibacteria group bacterium]
MSFLKNLFQKKESGGSVILIDIGGESVAGAYVRYEVNELPKLLYTRRLPIEIQNGEERERAMVRALSILGKNLIREGAPVLARTTGSGSADMILVSIDAPWQETRVRTEHFEQDEPFEFTKDLFAERLKESSITPSEKLLADESIIGSILNGYETHNPYGRQVRRAEIVVLTSLIEKDVAYDITSVLEGLYHTRNILPISGSSLRYQAMRTVFPHERDSISIDATSGSLTTIALVRKGIFVTMSNVTGSPNEDVWTATMTNELSEIAKRYPLPRTIFLLARESDTPSLRDRLGTVDFGSLWLSDNPPKIISVMKEQMSSMVRQTATEPADIVLLLMALYFQHQRSTLEDAL